jgi:plastocyanin
MTRRLAIAPALAATVLLLPACGAGGGTPAPTAAPSTAPAASASPASPAASEAPASQAAGGCQVGDSATATPAEIKGFAFPSGLTVAAGEAITWTNADSAPHTVTFDDGTCDSGSIAGGGSVTVTYTTPGTYSFLCRIHPNMKGSLEVSG